MRIASLFVAILAIGGLIAFLMPGSGGIVACVPDTISQVATILNERFIGTATVNQPQHGSDSRIKIYLDYSESIRGYLLGAGCADCQPPVSGKPESLGAPSRNAAGRSQAKPANNDFYDQGFASLLRALTSAPLKAAPGVDIEYHLFAEKVSRPANSDDPVIENIAKSVECYRSLNPKERRDEKARQRCYFDKMSFANDVGVRNRSPVGQVFSQIAGEANPNNLYIVASDLFFSNQEVIGPTASAIVPTASLLKKGFQVQIFGFQLPFSGGIDDVPRPAFRVTGLLPFYFVAIGSPQTVNKFAAEMAGLANEIRLPPSPDGEKGPTLAEAGRYHTLLIGSNGIQEAFPTVQTSLSFPAAAKSPATSMIGSNLIQEEREVPFDSIANNEGISLRWTITDPKAANKFLSASDYDMEVVAWRRTGAAGNSDCSSAWDVVPSALLGAGAPTNVERNVLEARLFADGAARNLSVNTTHLIQALLYPRSKSDAKAGVEWVVNWSSNNNTVDEDARAAGPETSPRKGAIIRTFNLKQFVESLQAAAPGASATANAPLAQAVFAVQFR
jgi:hypothetical protein